MVKKIVLASKEILLFSPLAAPENVPKWPGTGTKKTLMALVEKS